MIEYFPTAEETRQKISVQHFNSDMKQMLRIINMQNGAGNIFVLNDLGSFITYTSSSPLLDNRVSLYDKEKTFNALKDLGYIIKQCPHESTVYSIWWETPFLEEDEINDSRQPFNWRVV
jgi:hypothetical protein